LEGKNLWAPWRIGYIQGLEKSDECFICHNLKNKEDDKNLVLWRSAHSIVILNRFPYNNGHLLIAPSRHISSLDEAKDDELLDLIKLVGQAQKALNLAIKPHGFNVGINLGRCGGAGLPEHLHIHIVPRWDGDTNFISTCSETRVISQSLTECLSILKKVSKENNLPDLS
jgi:ATP adenylyltransferase